MQTTTSVSPKLLEAIGTLDALTRAAAELSADIAAQVEQPDKGTLAHISQDASLVVAETHQAMREAEDAYDDAETSREQFDGLIAAVLDHERGLADWGDVLRIARLNA
jgi:hypothetical protein